MLNLTNYSISGNSNIDGMDVAYFNASYSKNGNFSVNMSVNDKKTYESNKAQVDADFEEFKSKADEYEKTVGGMDE